jgi:hypothetical protein
MTYQGSESASRETALNFRGNPSIAAILIPLERRVPAGPLRCRAGYPVNPVSDIIIRVSGVRVPPSLLINQ